MPWENYFSFLEFKFKITVLEDRFTLSNQLALHC